MLKNNQIVRILLFNKRVTHRSIFFCIVERKFSALYRSQTNESKEEINDLNDKLRQINNEKKNIEDDR